MATSSKGRPLVADRRGTTGAAGSKRTTAKSSPPRRPPVRSRARQHGLVARFFLFLWRIVWGVLWRVGAVGATILACAVLYFYVQLPPLSTLLDARARGSVTLLDRDGKVYAWRGETYGGQVTAENISPNLLHAVIATEDKRYYQHFGISPMITAARSCARCRLLVGA